MIAIIKQAFHDFSDDKCPRIAAALAYYTAFALAPTLLLIVSVCQIVFDPQDVRGRVESEIASVVGADGAEQVKHMLDTTALDETHGALATTISIGVMLLGATGLFVQLQSAMNDVWEVQPDPKQGGITNFLTKRLVSLGMVLTIAFLFIVSLTASAALHAFDNSIDQWLPGTAGSTLLTAGNYALSFGLITCLFAAMFKFLPDAKINWSDVSIGAVSTAAFFMIGKFAIALYVGSESMGDAYGAAGSLVLILMWVYYSALIVLFGAEFTQAWAKQRGDGIVPEAGALHVVKRVEPVKLAHKS